MLLMGSDRCLVVRNFTDDENEGEQERDIEDIDVEENEDGKKEHFFIFSIVLKDTLIAEVNLTSRAIIEVISIYPLDIYIPPPEYTI